jgi:hypothetical protein
MRYADQAFASAAFLVHAEIAQAAGYEVVAMIPELSRALLPELLGR